MADRKYQIDTEENRIWMKELGEELLDFGRLFPSPSGGAYYLGDDGKPWKDRPRETWITCRMAHVYSIGTRLGRKGSNKLADSAMKGLLGELKDIEHGGWYAGVTPDGSILPDKQCYAHAFVILAATSLLLAKRKGAEELLQEALSVYDRYFWDDDEGLAVDTWDTEFKKCSSYRGVNANMHTVEAFLAAADALHEEKFRRRAGRIVRHVILWAAENDWRIPEHFREDWKPELEYNQEKPDDPFKPYGATPGHGIEWARLITQWAYATFGDDEAASKEFFEAAEKLYQTAISDAWNADGAEGIVYTTDWKGKPIVHDRMHWTLAEAINTSAVLYRLTGEERYASDYSTFLSYLDTTVLDKKNGSWFHQLDENNRLKGTVWPGKSDLYHAFQATLIPYNERIGTSIAAAIV